ncbi:MAG: hypothetical protein CMO42_11620 [Verrucomicrobiales bacterium]|nr:hypothetical protein [Verrucomicrobiales bacterium]
MKFWEFWKQWFRNVLANKHVIKISIYGFIVIILLLLELAGCNLFTDPEQVTMDHEVHRFH